MNLCNDPTLVTLLYTYGLRVQGNRVLADGRHVVFEGTWADAWLWLENCGLLSPELMALCVGARFYRVMGLNRISTFHGKN